ncbi:MAG: hypothetical protein ACRDNS_09855, partial [Trebonia sp.]
MADASATLTGTQSVTIGAGSRLLAIGNVNLTAGDDPNGFYHTELNATTSAQGYVRGLIAIPDTNATSDVTNNSTLTVGAGTTAYAGENATLTALLGNLQTSADGTGHGYELGFIPATNHGSNANPPSGSGDVTMDGTVIAGYYNQLDLTVPNCANDGIYCSTAPTATATEYPFAVQYVGPNDPLTNPDGTPTTGFIAGSWAAGLFPDSLISQIDAASSTTGVGAMIFGPLFASGGDVTINATSVTGTGSATAQGAPSITIENSSPDYLVLGDVTIPNLPGGNVLFTGGVQSWSGAHAVSQGGVGAISVNESYSCASVVGSDCVGNSTYGPAIMVTGAVDNDGGVIDIANAYGSFFQNGTVLGQQVNVNVPNGAAVISLPAADPYIAGSPNPYSEWESS